MIWYIFAGYEPQISCDIIYNYVVALSQALSSLGYSTDNYGEPQEFINSLIHVQRFDRDGDESDSNEEAFGSTRVFFFLLANWYR